MRTIQALRAYSICCPILFFKSLLLKQELFLPSEYRTVLSLQRAWKDRTQAQYKYGGYSITKKR